MILLDTDHLTALRYRESAGYAILEARILAARDESFATTVVSAEEQMRGWLALVGRFREVREQIPAYERLREMFTFFGRWQIVPLDGRAVSRFEAFKKQKVRIGTQDLKIAAIAIANDALLLTANLKDFRRVPDLRVENWLQEPAETT
jgi:tRNA(fMet)-specific endonuclease VapC